MVKAKQELEMSISEGLANEFEFWANEHNVEFECVGAGCGSCEYHFKNNSTARKVVARFRKHLNKTLDRCLFAFNTGEDDDGE